MWVLAPGFGVKTEAARRGAESSKFIMQMESPFENAVYIFIIFTRHDHDIILILQDSSRFTHVTTNNLLVLSQFPA